MIIKVTYQESKKDGFNDYFALRLFVIIWNYFSKVIEIEPLQLFEFSSCVRRKTVDISKRKIYSLGHFYNHLHI